MTDLLKEARRLLREMKKREADDMDDEYDHDFIAFAKNNLGAILDEIDRVDRESYKMGFRASQHTQRNEMAHLRNELAAKDAEIERLKEIVHSLDTHGSAIRERLAEVLECPFCDQASRFGCSYCEEGEVPSGEHEPDTLPGLRKEIERLKLRLSQQDAQIARLIHETDTEGDWVGVRDELALANMEIERLRAENERLQRYHDAVEGALV